MSIKRSYISSPTLTFAILCIGLGCIVAATLRQNLAIAALVAVCRPLMHPDFASPQAGTLHLPAVHLQLLLHPAGPLQPAGRAQRTVGRHLVERAAYHHHPDRAALPFPLEAGRQHPHHRGRGAGGILPDGSRQPHRVPGSVDLFQRIHLQHVPRLLNHGAAGNVLQANRPADVPVLPTDAHRHTERLLAEIHRVRRHRVRCPDGKRYVQDAPAAPNHPLFLYFHRCGQLRIPTWDSPACCSASPACSARNPA